MASKSPTDKQKLFVAAYVALPNATKAAKTAGYSEKTAYSQGQRLLKNVEIRKAIDQGMEAKHKEIKMQGVKLIQKIEEIALDASNPKSERYNGHVALKAIFYLGREQKMEFATEKHEIAQPGDLAHDILAGRHRLKQFRDRPGMGRQPSRGHR